jgi:hypothetical protein
MELYNSAVYLSWNLLWRQIRSTTFWDVAPQITDVSHMPTAFISSVYESNNQVSDKQNTAVCFAAVFASSVYFYPGEGGSMLLRKASNISQTTRPYIPEDGTNHI